MNRPKCDELDYINFLIAAQTVFSSVEASRTHPAEENAPAHDAYTRLLQRLPPDSQALWQEVKQLVALTKGVLVVDDSTLDKPYASQMALVMLPTSRAGQSLLPRSQPHALRHRSARIRMWHATTRR